MSFPTDYRTKLVTALGSIDTAQVDEAIRVFAEAREQDRQIFVFGNGGSAATANHFACDIVKGASYGREKRFRIMALSEQIPTMTAYANDVGYVGWVPQGAFPGLDGILFGDEETSADLLAEGEVSVPVSTVDGIYIVHKLATEEGRDITDVMRGRLLFQAVHQWQMEQLTRGSKEGWLKMNFNSKWYSWVAEQVGISAPRHTQGVSR